MFGHVSVCVLITLLGVVAFAIAIRTLSAWQERHDRENAAQNIDDGSGDVLPSVMDVLVIPMGNQVSLPPCPNGDHPLSVVHVYQNNSEHDDYSAGDLQILACGTCNKVFSGFLM